MKRSARARLAIGMTALALAVAALVAVASVALARWWGTDPEASTVTRVERVGNQVVVVQVQEDMQGAQAADRARDEGLRWLLIALGAAFVPAALLAWLVAGRVLRPVEEVTKVAERVDSPASPARVGPTGREDELGRMAAGFDQMLDRLDEAERERRRLLAEVVHELRTPLAVAMTNLELEGPEHADAARRALERMSRTVDDLARDGRLATGETAKVDLATEARGLAVEQAGPAGRRGLGLEVGGPDHLAVRTDRASLRTAVGNLLANAVRLAPTGSVVQVRWGAVARWAWVAVADEGPGIAPAHHVAVFDRGWQGGEPREGGGLGLTIARQLVEAQGGRLTVTSKEGAGSTFVVWLPLVPDATAAEVVTGDGVHPVTDPLASATPTPA